MTQFLQSQTRTLCRNPPELVVLRDFPIDARAGIAGRAKAQQANGRPVRGRLVANIAPRPPGRHVDPATGRVVEGARPLIP